MLYLLPLIAALTGWITNLIAVKMLFHPRKKINLGLFSIQGIFPKRQHVLAEQLGELVSRELFSVEDLKRIVEDPEMLSGTEEKIGQKIDSFMENFVKSNPMLGMFLSGGVREKIKSSLMKELDVLLPELIDGLVDKLEEKVDIKAIVKEKVQSFSSDEIEKMLYGIMSKEFRFIEILGGILGFIIGLIQLLIVLLEK